MISTPPHSPTLRSISQGTSGLSNQGLTMIQEDTEYKFPTTPGSVDSAMGDPPSLRSNTITSGGGMPQISITDDHGEVRLPSLSDSSPEDEMMMTPTERSDFMFPPMYSSKTSFPIRQSSTDSVTRRPSITQGIGRPADRGMLVRQDAVHQSRDRHEAYIQNENHRHTFPLSVSTMDEEDEELNYKKPVIMTGSLIHCQNILNTFPTIEKTPSGTITITLSDSCSNVESHNIVLIIKSMLMTRAPHLASSIADPLTISVSSNQGVEIKLEVYEGPESHWKGLKLCRISGNYMEYSQLCQEVLSCISS